MYICFYFRSIVGPRDIISTITNLGFQVSFLIKMLRPSEILDKTINNKLIYIADDDKQNCHKVFLFIFKTC